MHQFIRICLVCSLLACGPALAQSGVSGEDVPTTEQASSSATSAEAQRQEEAPVGQLEADPAGGQTALQMLDARLRPFESPQSLFTLGGYIQPSFEGTFDSDADANDYDGFYFRNSRLIAALNHELTDHFAYGAKIELEFQRGTPQIVDLYGQLDFIDRMISVKVGQFKVAFSLSQLTSDGRRQFALSRSGETNVFALNGFRDRGIRLDFNFDTGPVAWTLMTSLTNGDGPNDIRNDDQRFLYAAFLDIAPLGRFTLDEPDLANSPFRIGFGGSVWGTDSIGNDEFGLSAGLGEARAAGHVRVHFRGLSLRGEYLWARRSGPDGISGGETYRRGFYAQAGYVLPWIDWPQLEVSFRFQNYDLDNNQSGSEGVTTDLSALDITVADTNRYEVGLAAYILDHRLKVQAIYRITDLQEGFTTDENGDRVLGDAVLVNLQVGAF